MDLQGPEDPLPREEFNLAFSARPPTSAVPFSNCPSQGSTGLTSHGGVYSFLSLTGNFQKLSVFILFKVTHSTINMIFPLSPILREAIYSFNL
jgi:hypothetical protein